MVLDISAVSFIQIRKEILQNVMWGSLLPSFLANPKTKRSFNKAAHISTHLFYNMC